VKRVVKASTAGPKQARTRLARGAVIDAARSLFLDAGYAATTVDAISAASRVPPATVYRLFASKIGILKAVLDVAAGGDDQPIGFGDRPEIMAALALEDPYELVQVFARLTPDFMARVAPVQLMLIGAAATDVDAAALLAEHTRQRQRGQGRIAAALARLGALRTGLTERGAADIVYALMSPELYRLLVRDRGWAADRYATWLAESLAEQLLRPRATT
jgi:AcrR family transcriptional regulator